jgi:predicted TIM-barrel fold metal-dependent hydrolase
LNNHTRHTLVGIVCAFLLFALENGPAQSQADAIPSPVVDHHQHLLSPALAQLWNQSTPVTADVLIEQLDQAGIRQALVLSLAYAHGGANAGGDNEYEHVKAENDWTAKQVAPYPSRLRAFCSVDPLREYARAELERCSSDSNLRHGLKLHFANSGVDLRNAEHIQRLRELFRAANDRRMPIVAHVWTGDDQVGKPFDEAEARTFLNEVLPAAPDIPIQIAHLGGSGPRLDPGTKRAMLALANAVAASDPRTRRLYFDITTNVVQRSPTENAEFMAALVRRIGVERILYGSDLGINGNAPAAEGWKALQEKIPLNEAELRAIATNVAPYAHW